MRPEYEERERQSVLEEKFDKFFADVVSEWNPCFSDCGRWRYKWDDEVGAHDVEVTLDEDASSESKAWRAVSGRAPDRINLRSLLDQMFESKQGNDEDVKEAGMCKAIAARLNYLAVDRPDLQFASKCVSKYMTKPTGYAWTIWEVSHWSTEGRAEVQVEQEIVIDTGLW